MKRILLTIEYDGTAYSGWQKQPNQRTVQGEIEEAIFKSIGERVEIFGSGRTDAGVHAYNQTAHFDLKAPVPISKLADILNNVLPPDIAIKNVKEVNGDFHARFSLKKKEYLYKIYNGTTKNVFLANKTAWIKKELDIEKMKEAGAILVGKHDFRGFCSANTCVVDFVRKIYSLTIEREGDFIYIKVVGSGFLYNMVRIIAGTLVDYALDKISLEDIKNALKEGNRAKSGQTLPACGLYLNETKY